MSLPLRPIKFYPNGLASNTFSSPSGFFGTPFTVSPFLDALKVRLQLWEKLRLLEVFNFM